MTIRKVIVGTGAAGLLAALGASPMLLGASVNEVLNMPAFAAMLVLGGSVALLGTMIFIGHVMREIGL